ncbi:hypothetical protein SRB5_39090 [Streptomyces sp. RB5]|uniref:Uncharacterized protein n=1 Tax=Streptomyces smaragdinus TaxID=2585196 RepID=A0A7K0CJV6_9ACTN|nr:hypothetical protein [Streptomyces smaragdinus]MQY13757.1 hypothetical protein [Streptomyces smaragdinus]
MQNVPERPHTLTPTEPRTLLAPLPGVPLDNALDTARRILKTGATLDYSDVRAVCTQLGAAEWALTQLIASAEAGARAADGGEAR